MLHLAADVEVAVGVGLVPGGHRLAIDIDHWLLAGVEPDKAVF